MGKLRVLSGQAVCDILGANGFTAARRESSHRVMQGIVGDVTVSISVPLHRELAIGTLVSIIRQSGLPRRLFE